MPLHLTRDQGSSRWLIAESFRDNRLFDEIFSTSNRTRLRGMPLRMAAKRRTEIIEGNRKEDEILQGYQFPHR